MSIVESKNVLVINENQNLQDLGSLLQHCIITFNNCVLEYKEKQTELETYKKQYIALKESYHNIKKCEKCIANCSPSETTKKLDAQLPELICPEPQNLLHSPKKYSKDGPEINNSNVSLNDSVNDTKAFKVVSTVKYEKENISPIKDIKISDQSASDNEGTPTGKCSPIFFFNSKVEKKKLSNNWKTPESKVVKLSIPSSAKKNKPGGKLKQARFNFVHTKTSQIIDASNCSITTQDNRDIAAIVKVESIENDDTILPSPTSGPIKLEFMPRNSKKFESPSKAFKSKSVTKYMLNDLENSVKEMKNSSHTIDTHSMEFEDESINLLHPERNKHIDKGNKCEDVSDEQNPDYEAHQNRLKCLVKTKDEQKLDLTVATENSMLLTQSENRNPLMENINCDNVPTQFDTNTSISLLKPVGCSVTNRRNCLSMVKKENVEHIYKEPAPRKKAEKKALPGWKCDQCKNFYGVLHKDDPVMLEKRMSECSKHRGRTNPIQPQTPPGLWEPRWHVEEDTEVFNRQNNVT